jgi:elongation factor Tu
MSSLRSLAPLLRTARFSLRSGQAVNPLQHALKKQHAAGILNFSRGYASEFKRDKPHVNVGKEPNISQH